MARSECCLSLLRLLGAVGSPSGRLQQVDLDADPGLTWARDPNQYAGRSREALPILGEMPQNQTRGSPQRAGGQPSGVAMLPMTNCSNRANANRVIMSLFSEAATTA
jgi:hypothetical protein